MMRPRILTLCGAVLLLAVAQPAVTAGDGALSFVNSAPADTATRVVDVRDQSVCEKASLAGARCLPAADLFDGNGAPVDFHILRWLLGTIGLTGQERVLVAGDNADKTAAVGALLLLAGQHDVAVLDRPVAIPAGARGGTSRSITREAVFIAPMRDRLVAAAPDETAEIASGPPSERLRTFARRTADATQPVKLRLSP